MIRIAIFVSGGGTNCEQLCLRFRNHPNIEVALVVSSRATAGALERVRPFGVPTLVAGREAIAAPEFLTTLRDDYRVQFIVLAGFLLRVPDALVEAYRGRMVNLHPALLPSYGGPGMYGHRVHEAVKAAGETQTGMTIHWVSPVVDGGEVISQFSTPLLPTDTPDDIARREHELEMSHFAPEIERIVKATFGL